MTKQELKRYGEIDKELNGIVDQIESLTERLNSPRVQVLSDMPKGTVHSEMADLIAELIDLKEQYIRQYKTLLAEQKRIENAIESLDSPTQKALMRYKYIDGLTWEEVAVNIHYEWAQMHRLHAKALIKLS